MKRGQVESDVEMMSINKTMILNSPQYTEERMGKAERTEMDPHIVMLEKKTENTKNYTERIKNNATAVILPNPGDRLHHHCHLLHHPHCLSRDDWLFDSPETLYIPLILIFKMYGYIKKSKHHNNFQCMVT